MESSKKIDNLEKIVKLQERQLSELAKRIALLERENNRRKGEVTQLAAKLTKE